jgi:signal transduction histidine kinase
MAHRARNVPFIVAASISLVVLVAVTLGWLGWRLLSQEEALLRQQFRDRLEQAADTRLAGFLRTLADTEAWLGRMGTALPLDDDARMGRGAVLVLFSADAIHTRPSGVLPYLPTIPSPAALDPALFVSSEILEFQSHDLTRAAAQLAAIARRSGGAVRAEALLRLARVHNKAGRTDQALDIYAQLRDETAMGPAEAPYSLVSRFARTRLLAATQPDTAQREAVALATDLQSGRFAVGKATYAWYADGARTLAGTGAPAPAPEPLALSDLVDALWSEWQLFQQSGSRLMTKRAHRSGDAPMLAVMNANADRLAAVVYAGDAIRNWGLRPSDGADRGIRVRLLDEHGRSILGDGAPESEMRATRILSGAGLPWTLSLESSIGDSAQRVLASRRFLFAGALGGVLLLMCAACYAITRGVLREAAAGRLQSDFVSAVSHEFRTPLTTLRQLTELLAHGRVKDERRRRQYFDVLQKETLRLHQLVEDLLDFGRMDAGRRPYQLEPVDLSALVREGVQEYRREGTANGHRVELSAEPSALIVDADREAMRRVVRNLLENAAKYSPNSPVVWVETEGTSDSAVLRVRDDGIGIPVDEHARIFEKFVRGEGAKRACIEGTGIGLAMVKEIVEVHRGDIQVSSEVGRGSTFQVRLPLRTAAGSPS